MQAQDDNEKMLIRYLLGELSEAEQLNLEERFFTDDEFYAQLLACEDELRYDYARGTLSKSERQLFERRFLTSPEARRKTQLAQAVLARLDARSVEEAQAQRREPKKSPSWLASLLT